jgi:hypothetical protein
MLGGVANIRRPCRFRMVATLHRLTGTCTISAIFPTLRSAAASPAFKWLAMGEQCRRSKLEAD